jgi:hypothetical protein
MTEVTDTVCRGLEALPAAVARTLPALLPIDRADSVLDVRPELSPRRFDLVAGRGAVGTLLTADRRLPTAVSSDGAWRLGTDRWGLISRMAIAQDLVTGEMAAAYYPGLRAGGSIALHDTHFRLRLPFHRRGWWLFDEDDEPVANVEKVCTGMRCAIASRTFHLHETPTGPHPDLGLVLLVALWVITTALDCPAVGGC